MEFTRRIGTEFIQAQIEEERRLLMATSQLAEEERRNVAHQLLEHETQLQKALSVDLDVYLAVYLCFLTSDPLDSLQVALSLPRFLAFEFRPRRLDV